MDSLWAWPFHIFFSINSLKKCCLGYLQLNISNPLCVRYNFMYSYRSVFVPGRTRMENGSSLTFPPPQLRNQSSPVLPPAPPSSWKSPGPQKLTKKQQQYSNPICCSYLHTYGGGNSQNRPENPNQFLVMTLLKHVSAPGLMLNHLSEGAFFVWGQMWHFKGWHATGPRPAV